MSQHVATGCTSPQLRAVGTVHGATRECSWHLASVPDPRVALTCERPPGASSPWRAFCQPASGLFGLSLLNASAQGVLSYLTDQPSGGYNTLPTQRVRSTFSPTVPNRFPLLLCPLHPSSQVRTPYQYKQSQLPELSFLHRSVSNRR